MPNAIQISVLHSAESEVSYYPDNKARKYWTYVSYWIVTEMIRSSFVCCWFAALFSFLNRTN